MAVNKVTKKTTSGVQVLIDLTMLTVTPETLAEGVIAINAAGELIVGTHKCAESTDEFTNWAYKGIATDGSIYNGGKGYKENTRISTSSGNESSATGMSVTGFIPVHVKDIPGGCTIRIKDIDLTSGNSTLGWYASDFSHLAGGYCNSMFGAADANGVRSYTSTSGDRAYIRISGAFGSNPIITVDEEIQ